MQLLSDLKVDEQTQAILKATFDGKSRSHHRIPISLFTIMSATCHALVPLGADIDHDGTLSKAEFSELIKVGHVDTSLCL